MERESAHRCPKCGYEYEPWIEVCPDCGVPVEWTPPRLEVVKAGVDPHADPQWTVVANMPNAIIGRLIKSQLEDAGIPVLMMRAPSADIAQFSGNDFVPQDLRVPRLLAGRAREIIDSAPGDNYGPRSWQEWDYSDSEDEEPGEQEVEEPPTENLPPLQGNPNLPEGWSLLPSEADIDARQEVRRSHGQALKGWYWADTIPTQHHGDLLSEPGPEPDDLNYGEDDRPVDWRSSRRSRGYEVDDYGGDGWYAPNKWVRIAYGILLLAITLPFIWQLLGEMWALLGFSR